MSVGLPLTRWAEPFFFFFTKSKQLKIPTSTSCTKDIFVMSCCSYETFFLRALKKHCSAVLLRYFFLHFNLFFLKRGPLFILLHRPAPDDPTHLSRHWVIWVALYIEQSQRFDIRRRLQHRNPVTPLPPTLSSLHLCICDLLTNTLLQAILAAIVHFYFTKLFKGLISRMKKVGGNKKAIGGREQ